MPVEHKLRRRCVILRRLYPTSGGFSDLTVIMVLLRDTETCKRCTFIVQSYGNERNVHVQRKKSAAITSTDGSHMRSIRNLDNN